MGGEENSFLTAPAHALRGGAFAGESLVLSPNSASSVSKGECGERGEGRVACH